MRKHIDVLTRHPMFKVALARNANVKWNSWLLDQACCDANIATLLARRDIPWTRDSISGTIRHNCIRGLDIENGDGFSTRFHSVFPECPSLCMDEDFMWHFFERFETCPEITHDDPYGGPDDLYDVRYILRSINTRIQPNSVEKFKRLFGKIYRPDLFSLNERIPWTADYILKNRDILDLIALSSNHSVPWNPWLIDYFQDDLDWAALCKNPAVRWDYELLHKYRGRIDWDGICQNPGTIWEDRSISAFESHLNFGLLSSSTSFPWNAKILNAYSSRLDWNRIASNRSVCWSKSMLLEHVKGFDASTFLEPHLPFDAEVLSHASGGNEKVLRSLIQSVSGNRGPIWTDEFISFCRDHLKFLPTEAALYYQREHDLHCLYLNPTFPWSLDLFFKGNYRYHLRDVDVLGAHMVMGYQFENILSWEKIYGGVLDDSAVDTILDLTYL